MMEQSFTLHATSFTLLISIISVVAVLALSLITCWRWQFRRAIVGIELLRIGLVVAAVCLLNQPESTQRFVPRDLPSVVVLVDQSQSMLTQDVLSNQPSTPPTTGSSTDNTQTSPQDTTPQPIQPITRSDAVRPLLDNSFWKQLEGKVDVVPLSYSTDKNSGSDIHAALMMAMKEYPRLRAVVLASDGDWNSGPPPVDAATRYRLEQIPILAVPIGSRTRLPDLELLSFDVPSFGITNKNVRIPFTIESSLPRDHVAQVTLTSSSGSNITQDVRVAAMGRTSDAVVWKPETVGDATLTLRITPHPNERLINNNARSAPIAVRDERLRVLVIESLPRWEYRYLRNALSRDPGVEVSCLLFQPGLSKVGGGNSDYITTFPEGLDQLSKYDVVFLGDVGVDAKQLTFEQCELLKGLVEQQASGLVFMPGWQGNWQSLVESPLESLLPVVLDPAQPSGWGARTPSHFRLTELGRRSLLTKLADTQEENYQVWENLPGFQWYAPVIRAKAGTDTLCVHEDASNEFGRVPLLVTRTFGSGKVLFMGTDGAWRWRRGVEDLYHYRFWGQVVRWMAYQRNMAKGETMRFYYSPEQPQVRQTVAMTVNAMEKSGEPLSSGQVMAQIVSPSGRMETVTMQSTSGQWGAFTGNFQPAEPGEHKVTLSCQQNSTKLDARLFVQGATVEQIGKPARPEVLEELARVSRGELISNVSGDAIISKINELPTPQPKIRRVQLWSHPLVAATLIITLALFWTLRKVVGLV